VSLKGVDVVARSGDLLKDGRRSRIGCPFMRRNGGLVFLLKPYIYHTDLACQGYNNPTNCLTINFLRSQF
jgi:hypothetical protein